MDRPDQHLWNSREVARILSLVEAERRYYQEILAALPVGVATVNSQLEIVAVNRGFRQWFQLGQREWKSLPLTILFPAPEISACVSEALSSQTQQRHIPVRIKIQEGYRQALLSCVPVRNWEGVADEVLLLLEEPHGPVVSPFATERQELERLAAQRARVDALGRLAAKVSHSLNNIWMLISGYGEELLQALPSDSQQAGDVREILAGAERVGDLAKQLQEYSRRPAGGATPVGISGIFQDLEPQLRGRLVEGMELEIKIPRDAGWVLATSDGLSAAVLTLFDWALPNRGERGRITISAAPFHVPPEAAEGLASLLPGAYVALSLLSAGQAVSEEELSHLLEPAVGVPQKDESLLYPLHVQARQWGGDLIVTSKRDEGIRATLYLPFVSSTEPPRAVLEVEAKKPEPPPPAPAPPAATTLMVVEDEAGIRALMRKILQRQGYQVLEADCGPAALQLAAQHPTEIHLLVTDLMMPEMNGRELAERLTAERPQMRVLYVSGFTDDSSIYAQPLPKGTMFLQKPFTLGALLEKVRASLEQARRG